MKRLSDSKVFAIVVVLFAIVATIVLAKTVFGDAKKIKEETRELTTVSINPVDSVISKDQEFRQLIDTVIIYQERVKEVAMQNEFSVDSLNILKEELKKACTELDRTTYKLREVQKAIKKDTIQEYVVLKTPILLDGDSSSLEFNKVSVKKQRGLLNDYHEVKYNNIMIQVIQTRRFGFSANAGYGGMYGLDDGRFHHGPYIGAGVYLKL
jgi:hypothetical protein